MNRFAALTGIIAAGLLASLGTTGPARAGSGVGCAGDGCSILLSKTINLSGDVGSGPATSPIAVAPPPCLWEPIGDAATGSQYIIQQFGGAGPGAPFGVYQSLQLAKKLLRQNPPPAGAWYELPTNPQAPAAARWQCLQLPLFFFSRPGHAPPSAPIPPLTLAEYAFNHMLIPTPKLQINPADKGYVDLATFTWGRWGPRSAVTGGTRAYRVTATLGAETVSVWAQAAAFSVGVAGAPASAYTRYLAGCQLHGSRYPAGRPPASAGPGTPPDCGVLWRAPVAGAAVSGTVTWTVTWGMGVLQGPGPRALVTIQLTSNPGNVRVLEIQSVNGG